MIDRTVYTVIDREACVGCGLCVRVCPAETISMADGKAAVTGTESLSCGHCAAVCPTGAIRVTSLENDAQSFRTFESGDRWLPFGQFDAGELVRLMRSRRSCRNYTDQPVDRTVLEDLVRIGVSAPSGSNCQDWTFTILPTRSAVMTLGRLVGEFFERTNRMAEKAWLRNLLKLAGKPQLANYYRNYYESIQEGLEEWRRTGRERIFHGATAAILVGSRPGESCPREDALLASQNILLGAHCLGLGTCLIGFAVEAMRQEPSIKRAMGIPDAESVYAVVALGHPDEKYHGLSGRKAVAVRYFEG